MPDFENMTTTQFAAWQAEQQAGDGLPPLRIAVPLPTPAPPQDRYAPTTWGSDEYDFTTPSGQMCRMRKVPIEGLVESGLLDKLNTLSPRVDQLIKRSNNEPPAPASDTTDGAAMREMLSVLNDFIPLVVVAPMVHPTPKDPADRVEGLVYVSSVGLADQLAIMNEALGGLEKMATFRE